MGLVEVVIAVGLLVTLAAGVVHLFAMSARSVVRARHRISSLMLAVDQVERLRAGVLAPGTVISPLEARGEQTEYLDAAVRVAVYAGVVGRPSAWIERCSCDAGDRRPDPSRRRWRARPCCRAGWCTTGHADAGRVVKRGPCPDRGLLHLRRSRLCSGH